MDKQELQDFIDKHGDCKVWFELEGYRGESCAGEGYLKDVTSPLDNVKYYAIYSNIPEAKSFDSEVDGYKHEFWISSRLENACFIKSIRLLEEPEEDLPKQSLLDKLNSLREGDVVEYQYARNGTWIRTAPLYKTKWGALKNPANGWMLQASDGSDPGLIRDVRIISRAGESDKVTQEQDEKRAVTLEQFKNEKIAIHCETEEDKQNIDDYFESVGLTWWDSKSLVQLPSWDGVSYDEDGDLVQRRIFWMPDDYRIIKAKDFLRWNKQPEPTVKEVDTKTETEAMTTSPFRQCLDKLCNFGIQDHTLSARLKRLARRTKYRISK